MRLKCLERENRWMKREFSPGGHDTHSYYRPTVAQMDRNAYRLRRRQTLV